MLKKLTGYQKGVNLGGWLSQCCHTPAHYRDFITEDDIKTLSTWGIDHVRVPVDYDIFETAEGEKLPYGEMYLDLARAWCSRYGLNLIIDLHKTVGFSFDCGEQEYGFFGSAALQDRFYAIWERIASRYGDDPEHIAFELLNEITDRAFMEPWYGISRECVSRIRKYAPDTHILIGGYENNNALAVKDLPVPYDDKIVYNFHCYEPLIFTHQSAQWVENMPASFRTSFPQTAAAYRKESLALGIPNCDLPLQTADDATGTELFERIFAEAIRTAEERNVPLYCGEYGVIETADAQSTLRWYEAIHGAFEKFGIGRAAWSYKRMDFGLSDENRADILPVLKTLL